MTKRTHCLAAACLALSLPRGAAGQLGGASVACSGDRVLRIGPGAR